MGIVQLTNRSDINKSSLIDVGQDLHLITKPINKDNGSIGHDDLPFESPNKNPHACTII